MSATTEPFLHSRTGPPIRLRGNPSPERRDRSRTISIPPATGDDRVWLQVGTLLDGTSSAPVRGAHVVYNRKAILFVGADGCSPPRTMLRPGQDRPDVAAPELTLLPGLADAHAHLFLEGGELDPEKRAAHLRRSPAELLAAAQARLAKLVGLGLIAIRDAGDKDGVGLALSRLSASAARPLMPSVDSPGAAIYRAGRYGSFMGAPLDDYATPRACVTARVAAGADRIKLIATGIIDFKQAQVTGDPSLTTAEIAKLTEAARSFGRQTFAHASGSAGIDRVIEGGVDSVEHGFFMREDQLALMRDRQTAWVPTFAPVHAQFEHASEMGWSKETVAGIRRILDRHAASLFKAYALGVPIVAGSDAGSVGVAHGVGLLYEMEHMERAGLPSLAVINAATGVGSGRFGYREKFGRIAPGYCSRFILTEHSPLETVANLRRARTIIFDDTVLYANEDSDTSGL